MKICPHCNAAVEDNAVFCNSCGARIAVNEAPQPQPQPEPKASYDHTAEFSPKDISNNKVIAMLVYLMGSIGVIIALLASHDSPYAAFHVRQALKYSVCELLLLVLVIIPFLGWLAMSVGFGIIFVCRIICFFQICSGKAIEAPIVRSFGFLK